MRLRWDIPDTSLAIVFAIASLAGVSVLSPLLFPLVATYCGWLVAKDALYTPRMMVAATVGGAVGSELGFLCIWFTIFPHYYLILYPVGLFGLMWLGIGLGLLFRWREIRRQHPKTN